MSPDGSTKPLPEEKLLKLIREKSPRVGVSVSGSSGATSSLLEAHETKTGVSVLRWPRVVAAGLGIVLLVEIGCLIVQLMRPVPTLTIPKLSERPPAESGNEPTEAAPLPSLAQNAAPNLFAVPSGSAAPPGTPTRTGPSEASKQLASRLTLMGVVDGNPPQVIIEDSQTKKTYFVAPGQPVIEGAIVDQVQGNRVILDLAGEKIELAL